MGSHSVREEGGEVGREHGLEVGLVEKCVTSRDERSFGNRSVGPPRATEEEIAEGA